MEERILKVSLEQARKWYEIEDFKTYALEVYTEEELKQAPYENIRTFEDACKALKLDYENEMNIVNKLKVISPHTASVYQLDIVRRALNDGETPSLISGYVCIPYIRIYSFLTEGDYSYIKEKDLTICDTFMYNEKPYILVGGDIHYYGDYYNLGVGNIACNLGNVDVCFGLLACKSKAVAKHMSRYFVKLIFEVAYKQYDFIRWDDEPVTICNNCENHISSERNLCCTCQNYTKCYGK